ncbi:MAG: DUF814 domain-containing protein [Candidatus Riflebacteria bacterium]|nr:DUF814 domain-containing protein [Candidatus Riflebacteria bacterium]
MDYLTLKTHISGLSKRIKSKPILIRAYDVSGRSIFLRLKFDDSIQDLCVCLDSPNQGIWLSEQCTEVEKNSLIVRNINRLIINSRLVSVELAGDEKKGEYDRVVKLHFVAIDDYFGHRSDYYVFCEFTGRISDVFFCDSDYKILDRISRTSNNLVGENYRLPDSFKLLNPDVVEDKELLKAFASDSEEWVNIIGFLSPLMAKEISFRVSQLLGGDLVENRLKVFREILSESGSLKAYLYQKQNKVFALSAYELKHVSMLGEYEKKEFESINDAMNFVEKSLIEPKRLEQGKKLAISRLNRSLKQKKQLLIEQKKLKEKYEDSDKYQKLGDLITANIYRIKPGSTFLEAEDWNSGELVKIELDPSKTAAANAKKYFNLCKKSKRGVIEVEKRIESLISDIKWFEEQIWLVENAEIETWLQIEENTKTNRMTRSKEPSNKNKNAKNPRVMIKPSFEQNGCKYYVGHNAKQNDLITFKIGKKGDIWFHANDVPGAHVVLKKPEGDINEEDLLAGARFAALNSFAKNSSKVLVDYTDVSNVKRIPNGGLGQVSYTNQHTIVVELGD